MLKIKLVRQGKCCFEVGPIFLVFNPFSEQKLLSSSLFSVNKSERVSPYIGEKDVPVCSAVTRRR